MLSRAARRRVMRRVPVAPVMYCAERSPRWLRAAGMTATMLSLRTSRRRDPTSASTSFSSADTSRIALPASRAASSCAWMNSIAPTSTPRVGCEASSTLNSRPISRAIDDLLLIAAGKRARRQRGVARPDVERLDLRRAYSAIASLIERAVAREPMLQAEHEVVGDRSTRGPARAAAGLRGCATGRRRSRARTIARVTSAPSIAIVPDSNARSPAMRFDQLGLAVAFDAGDAEYLAGRDGERDAVDLARPAIAGYDE